MQKFVILAVAIVMVSMVFSTISFADGSTEQENKLAPSAPSDFGKSIATTPSGTIIVGAPLDDDLFFVVDSDTRMYTLVLRNEDVGTVFLYETWDNYFTNKINIDNPDPSESSRFGWSVASSLDNVLVGAPFNDYTYTEIETQIITELVERGQGSNGSREVERDVEVTKTVNSAGFAYLFDRNGELLLTLNKPSMPNPNDRFGWSVASTPDGTIIVGAPLDDVGAKNSGSVYLFNQNGNLIKKINNPDPAKSAFFGYSVASTDNGSVIVGASGSGSTIVYLFDETGRKLLEIDNPSSTTSDNFGASVASVGNKILVGAYGHNLDAIDHVIHDAGIAYLFDGITGSLLLTLNNPLFVQGEYFGWSVASTYDGDLIVGAKQAGFDNKGAVYVFDGKTGSLINTIHNSKPQKDGFFGSSVTPYNHGNKHGILIGEPNGFIGGNLIFDYSYVIDDVASKSKINDITVDSDGDGVLDNVDVCPAEDATGFDLDFDGCLDDYDGDGVYDSEDLCPTTPENFNGYRDFDGCPEVSPDTDSDGDGVNDIYDDCPDEYGSMCYNGCPVPDGEYDICLDF